MTFWGKCRGQIRGIDFSLAMIIFLITMGQVIVLTTTFIENSQNSQGLSSNQSVTENYAIDIISTPGSFGTDINWFSQTSATLSSSGWRFGLDNGNGSTSPYKLGRLADNSAIPYFLDYDQIAAASQIDRDFAIKISPTINVSIISIINPGGNDLSVLGRVISSGSPVYDAEIWLYSYDPLSNAINQLYTFTNETGYFLETITSTNVAAANFQLVSVITRYGVGNGDIDYDLFFPVPSTVTEIGQTILDATGTGFAVQVSSDQTGGGPSANNVHHFALYGGYGLNITSATVNPSNGGSTWDQVLEIPSNGMVGLFTYDSNGGDNIAFTSFPLVADNELRQSMQPTDVFGTQSTVYDQIISVRGVLLRFSLTTWS